ncbi:MAG TPA: PHB depolymerase family esterase [Labilithrix sp.]|nr:PHB depolymerase family esterase [Labilithrix sp.]
MPLRDCRLWLAGLAFPLAAMLAACAEAPYAPSPDTDRRDVGSGESDETSQTLAPGEVTAKGGRPKSITEFACPGGNTIKPGLNNNFMVNGAARTLTADFPAKTDQPMAVIFSWHGYQQDTEQFRKEVQFNPNQDPAIPAIIVTPDDTNILPPLGLDWKIVNPAPGQVNVDLAFFEAMLGCLNAQHKIDATRIYSTGFSAGSVMTSLLHAEYPKVVTTVANISGAWMNDKAETASIAFPLNGIAWNWPPLDSADRGNVLLTHGGDSDVTVANIMNLEKSAQAAFPYLKVNRRTVVDCAHDKGHTGHPEVPAAVITKYLFAHRTGQPSPYANGAFGGYPGSCQLRLP